MDVMSGMLGEKSAKKLDRKKKRKKDQLEETKDDEVFAGRKG